MDLARIKPDGPGFERLTFECQKCARIENLMVRQQIGPHPASARMRAGGCGLCRARASRTYGERWSLRRLTNTVPRALDRFRSRRPLVALNPKCDGIGD